MLMKRLTCLNVQKAFRLISYQKKRQSAANKIFLHCLSKSMPIHFCNFELPTIVRGINSYGDIKCFSNPAGAASGQLSSILECFELPEWSPPGSGLYGLGYGFSAAKIVKSPKESSSSEPAIKAFNLPYLPLSIKGTNMNVNIIASGISTVPTMIHFPGKYRMI
jgi:hypothetical protein